MRLKSKRWETLYEGLGGRPPRARRLRLLRQRTSLRNAYWQMLQTWHTSEQQSPNDQHSASQKQPPEDWPPQAPWQEPSPTKQACIWLEQCCVAHSWVWQLFACRQLIIALKDVIACGDAPEAHCCAQASLPPQS